jgi:pyrroloquinoline quinone biosynthesis protein D
MSTLFPDTPAVSRTFRLQWEEAQQGYVLLYPEGMVKLNVSAGEILKCCDGKTSVDDIVSTLEAKFGMTGLRTGCWPNSPTSARCTARFATTRSTTTACARS